MPPARVIVLFGTSANPPTGDGGHVGLVRWAANEAEVEGQRPEQIWVLPVYRHAFEEKRGMPSFEHRLAMARLAFEDVPGLEGRVLVSDAERRAAARMPTGARVGTIDVVRLLSVEHPGTRLALLLGADTYLDVVNGRWKESEELLRTTPLLVVPRKGWEAVPASKGAPLLEDVRSTRARGATNAELERLVGTKVARYIRDHRLYAYGEVV